MYNYKIIVVTNMAFKCFPLHSFIPFILLCFLSNFTFANIEKKSPVEFLKHIKGGKKGDNIKGIKELKQYLQYFGYLNSNNSIQKNGDYFDQSLESALKTYQLNFNVKPSGILDEPTISAMEQPRCGVPDVINDTNMMISRNLNSSFHLHMIMVEA